MNFFSGKQNSQFEPFRLSVDRLYFVFWITCEASGTSLSNKMRTDDLSSIHALAVRKPTERSCSGRSEERRQPQADEKQR